MTSIHHIPARATGPQTVSFGSHRQSDRPASAIRAGASSMPSAWQSRGISTGAASYQYGAPVRSIGDIMMDPLRKALSTRVGKVASGCLVVLVAISFFI